MMLITDHADSFVHLLVGWHAPEIKMSFFWGPEREKKILLVPVLCLSFIICLSIPSEGLWKNLVGPTGKIEKIKFLPLSEPVCWSHHMSLWPSRREQKGNQDPSIAGVTPQRGSSSQEGTGTRPSSFHKQRLKLEEKRREFREGRKTQHGWGVRPLEGVVQVPSNITSLSLDNPVTK
jgi:hypothetical protein